MVSKIDRPVVFVAMCFDGRLQPIYQKVVQPVLETHGFDCSRGDEILKPGVIVDQVREAIQLADLVFCDLTFNNPNVFYELGVAHTLKKPTLLISQSASGIPFDVAHMRVIPYEDSKIGLLDLREQLVRALGRVAPIDPDQRKPRTDRPESPAKYQLNEIEVQRSALYSNNPELIRYAVRYLGETHHTGSYGRIQQIAETSYSPPDLVRDALFALYLIDSEKTLRILVASAFGHPDYLVRERALMLLGNYSPDTKIKGLHRVPSDVVTLLEGLRHCFSDSSWGVRRTVCEVMGAWADERAMPSLLSAMSDSAVEVSLAAREAQTRISRRPGNEA